MPQLSLLFFLLLSTPLETPPPLAVDRRRFLVFRSAALVLIGGLLVAGCGPIQPDTPAARRQYAFVSNGRSNSVTVVDLDGFRAVRTVRVETISFRSTR